MVLPWPTENDQVEYPTEVADVAFTEQLLVSPAIRYPIWSFRLSWDCAGQHEALEQLPRPFHHILLFLLTKNSPIGWDIKGNDIWNFGPERQALNVAPEPAGDQQGNIKNRAHECMLLNWNQNRFHVTTSVAFQASQGKLSIAGKVEQSCIAPAVRLLLVLQ
jgi:hypothetical protein